MTTILKFIKFPFAGRPGFYPRDRRSGFTLLELLIYISVLSILSLVVVSTLLNFNRGQGQIGSKTEVNSNLRFAVEKITQDLRSASSVSLPASASSTSDSLAMSVSGATVTYCVVNGQLKRQAGTACNASSEAITSGSVTVLSAAFARLENTNTVLAKTETTIQIDLDISSKNSGPDKAYSARKKTAVTLW